MKPTCEEVGALIQSIAVKGKEAAPADVHRAVDALALFSPLSRSSGDGHELEDYLFRTVLSAVAAGAPDASMLAVAALRSTDLTFPRWTE